MTKWSTLLVTVAAAALLAGCPHRPPNEPDPDDGSVRTPAPKSVQLVDVEAPAEER
ncbi:MAG: hypothetical protein JXX28_11350 [Deltaproteobacteria bacterium]|nr:hypothetical protein [Deltaproteobacteria bacterium]